MPTRRSFLLGLTTVLMALAVAVLPVLAEELIGTIKSVDVENKKVVITPTTGDKDVEVTINSSTSVENAKGKVLKKFSLDRLNPGGRLEITHDKGVASKVVLKKGAVKKKDQ